ncbi:solute carrier family 45 member 4 [Lates japonicus]|uniref:Solute carrier family 45 member 4 n=1 Tax=Lates japonicus TaxID=270547 RepID=A0AAD3R846_LATJO|nr:solute carrier family 45 member 4 [Lates japonicus]
MVISSMGIISMSISYCPYALLDIQILVASALDCSGGSCRGSVRVSFMVASGRALLGFFTCLLLGHLPISKQWGGGISQNFGETRLDDAGKSQQQPSGRYRGDRETQLLETQQGGQGHHHHHFLSHGE